MTCKEAPVAQQAWKDTDATYDGVTFLGIIGDQSHKTRRSSHNCAPMQESGNYDPNYAHALDIGVGTNRTLALSIVSGFLGDPRLRYCIYDGELYYPDGDEEPDADASGHETHVHLSFRPGTTHDTRPFNLGDDELTDADKKWMTQEFVNITKRTDAIVEKYTDMLHDQEQKHNEKERERDAADAQRDQATASALAVIGRRLDAIEAKLP